MESVLRNPHIEKNSVIIPVVYSKRSEINFRLLGESEHINGEENLLAENVEENIEEELKSPEANTQLPGKNISALTMDANEMMEEETKRLIQKRVLLHMT